MDLRRCSPRVGRLLDPRLWIDRKLAAGYLPYLQACLGGALLAYPDAVVEHPGRDFPGVTSQLLRRKALDGRARLLAVYPKPNQATSRPLGVASEDHNRTHIAPVTDGAGVEGRYGWRCFGHQRSPVR